MKTSLVSMGGLFAAMVSFGSMVADAQSTPTLLLRQPSVSRDHIAFVYAGDIWVSNRAGAKSGTADIAPGGRVCSGIFA